MRGIGGMAVASLWLCIGGSAYAGEFRYQYVDVGLGISETSLPGVDLDGVTTWGAISVEVLRNAYLGIEYESSDYQDDIESSSTDLTIGAHAEVAPSIDAYIEWSWLDAEVKQHLTAPLDDTGHALGVGVRNAKYAPIELHAEFVYVDIFDDTYTVVGIGARARLDERHLLGISYSWTDDTVGIGVSIRREF